MNILAFDTCLGACSVAVAKAYGTAAQKVARRFERMDRGQAERLMPMISETLAEAGLAYSDIDRIGVTTGPGTFTGTRISVAAARALMLAAQRPVVVLSSLEVIASSPAIRFDGAESELIVAMNANRAEAYVQVFDAASRSKKTEPMLVRIDEITVLGNSRNTLVAGTAAGAMTIALNKAGLDAACGPADLQPDIGDALDFIASAEPLASAPRPLYLRPPDAKPQDGKSLARHR